MYLVTGGAGFIGSHLVRALNDRGDTNILVVDSLARGAKFKNLADCQVADYEDKLAFRKLLEQDRLPEGIRCIFHPGACTGFRAEIRRTDDPLDRRRRARLGRPVTPRAKPQLRSQ